MSKILTEVDNLIEETVKETISNWRSRIHPIRSIGNSVESVSKLLHGAKRYSPEKIGKYIRRKWHSGSGRLTPKNPSLDKTIGYSVLASPLAITGGAYVAKKATDKSND